MLSAEGIPGPEHVAVAEGRRCHREVPQAPTVRELMLVDEPAELGVPRKQASRVVEVEPSDDLFQQRVRAVAPEADRWRRPQLDAARSVAVLPGHEASERLPAKPHALRVLAPNGTAVVEGEGGHIPRGRPERNE